MSLRIGIAGLRRGVSFANVFSHRPDCIVVAGCDPNRERAEAFRQQFETVEAVYADYGEFCGHELDAIVIVTPAPTHAECSVQALRAGKHVLCEVPAVCTLEEGFEVVRAVEETGRKYMFAENVNFFACFETYKQLIDEGKIGKIIYAEGEYIHDCRSLMENRDDGLGGGVDGKPTWRASMHPIQYCTHDLGPLLWLMEDRIVRAVGMSTGCNVAPELGVTDIEVAIFQTAKGAVVKQLTGFAVAREPSHHFFSIYGTKGCLESDRYGGLGNHKFYSEELKHLPRLMDLPVGTNHPHAPPHATAGGHGTSEYYMIDGFVRCILDDTKPPIDVYEGLDYTFPGVCAAESIMNDSQPVTVPDPREPRI